jgi:DNA-binding NarL/FixJ family response regulator
MATTNRQHRRQALLTSLACGATVAQAAAQTGVTERTVYRYLADAAFRQELQSLQDEAIQRGAARLTAAAPEALKVLLEMQASSMPPSVRRAAARDVWDLSQRHRETITLEKRLQNLENYAQGTQPDCQNAPVPGNGSVSAAPASAPSRPRRKRGTHLLLNALACGATVAQAAAKARVSQRTVYRRLADHAFRQQLRSLQTEMTQRAAALLLAGTMQATKTLIELLAPSTPPSVRRAAARDVLELGLCLRQMVELENRVRELEVMAGVPVAA